MPGILYHRRWNLEKEEVKAFRIIRHFIVLIQPVRWTPTDTLLTTLLSWRSVFKSVGLFAKYWANVVLLRISLFSSAIRSLCTSPLVTVRLMSSTRYRKGSSSAKSKAFKKYWTEDSTAEKYRWGERERENKHTKPSSLPIEQVAAELTA